MDQVTLKDWRDTEYTVGSKIVYVNGDSSGNTWRTGVVVDIVENPKWDANHPYWEPQYIVKWQADKGPWGGPTKIGRLSNLSKIMAL